MAWFSLRALLKGAYMYVTGIIVIPHLYELSSYMHQAARQLYCNYVCVTATVYLYMYKGTIA